MSDPSFSRLATDTKSSGSSSSPYQVHKSCGATRQQPSAARRESAGRCQHPSDGSQISPGSCQLSAGGVPCTIAAYRVQTSIPSIHTSRLPYTDFCRQMLHDLQGSTGRDQHPSSVTQEIQTQPSRDSTSLQGSVCMVAAHGDMFTTRLQETQTQNYLWRQTEAYRRPRSVSSGDAAPVDLSHDYKDYEIMTESHLGRKYVTDVRYCPPAGFDKFPTSATCRPSNVTENSCQCPQQSHPHNVSHRFTSNTSRRFMDNISQWNQDNISQQNPDSIFQRNPDNKSHRNTEHMRKNQVDNISQAFNTREQSGISQKEHSGILDSLKISVGCLVPPSRQDPPSHAPPGQWLTLDEIHIPKPTRILASPTTGSVQPQTAPHSPLHNPDELPQDLTPTSFIKPLAALPPPPSPPPVVTQADLISAGLKRSYRTGGQKPSYLEMVASALLSSTDCSLPLSKIYDYLPDHYPHIRALATKSWRNSVRHSLSSQPCFVKVPGSARAHTWRIHEANVPDFRNRLFDSGIAKKRIKEYIQRSTTLLQPASLTGHATRRTIPVATVTSSHRTNAPTNTSTSTVSLTDQSVYSSQIIGIESCQAPPPRVVSI